MTSILDDINFIKQRMLEIAAEETTVKEEVIPEDTTEPVLKDHVSDTGDCYEVALIDYSDMICADEPVSADVISHGFVGKDNFFWNLGNFSYKAYRGYDEAKTLQPLPHHVGEFQSLLQVIQDAEKKIYELLNCGDLGGNPIGQARPSQEQAKWAVKQYNGYASILNSCLLPPEAYQYGINQFGPSYRTPRSIFSGPGNIAGAGGLQKSPVVGLLCPPVVRET